MATAASPVLDRVPLFADLDRAEREAIGAAMRRRRYRKGSLIHASEAMGADLYVIESGRVTIQLPSDRGQALNLALLGPGDFFGEISLLDDAPWFGDAMALDDCQLLLLAKREFLHLLDTHPSVSRRLVAIICGRWRLGAQFAQDLAFLDVPTRLARALVTLVNSEGWGWTGNRGCEEPWTIDITQSALAAHVGATRESVNKWLGYYERQGYISRARDRITILRLEDLRARAEAG